MFGSVSHTKNKKNMEKENEKLGKKQIKLHRCENLYGNEIVKINERAYVPNSYGDRFIPRRYTNQSRDAFNIKHIVESLPRDILQFKQIKHYWRIHNYSQALNQVFQVDKTTKTLSFTDVGSKLKDFYNIKNVNRSEPYYKNLREFDWPCRPRNKPSSFIESTHDLPAVLITENKICWSNKGVIAAAFGQRDLVLWKPPCELTTVFCLPKLETVSFHPGGDILLTVAANSLNTQVLKIWNVGFDRLTAECGLEVHSAVTAITCATWHTEEDYIFLGTTTGKIMVYQYNVDKKKLSLKEDIESHHHRTIISIKCSVNGTYFASTDVSGSVIVFKFAILQIEEHLIFEGCGGMACFAWHPWNENLMVFVERTYSSIYLSCMASREVKSYYYRADRNCQVNSVSFSKLTGELCLGCAYMGDNGKRVFELIVLGSMNRVVDILPHGGLVRALMWSPDGKLLATASTDRTLSIWNFNSSQKEKPKKKSLLTFNSIGDQMAFNPSIR